MNDLDSTQTLRAIPRDELYNSHQPRWHVVQLVVSDRPVNLDMMPRLEAFAAHRLYAVAAKQDAATTYSLRLGFFPDEETAEVVCGYLRTFFSSPSILRVSTAEHARFSPPAAPRAAVQKSPSPAPAAAPRHTVAQQPVVTNSARKKLPASIEATGTQKLVKRSRTLAEELREEAREVQLSRSGKHRVPEQSQSWLTRLLGGTKR